MTTQLPPGIEARIEAGRLIVSVPIEEEHPQPSSTGKTMIVASTYGNKVTSVKVLGKRVTVGLTAYIGKG